MAWNFKELQRLNPFSKHFQEKEIETFRALDKEINRNTYSIPNTIDAFHTTLPDASFSNYAYSLTEIFRDKAARINYYRGMSLYPHIGKAIDIVCDECIAEDSMGKYATMDLDPQFAKKLKPIEIENVQAQFSYIMDMVFRSGENNSLWDLFYRWLIDGELYLEIVANSKGNSVIGYNILPPQWTFPIYDGNYIAQFVETPQHLAKSGQYIPSATPIYFDEDQISYSNFGLTGYTKQDTMGYLEAARRSYQQLKSMEDSLVIYRLNRATERRIWNIELGMMNEAKSKSTMEKIRQHYRQNQSYNAETGQVEERKNFISMSEDYFFPMRDGKKSDVSAFSGNVTFNTQVDDLKMVMKTLYDSLKLPETRWGSESEGIYTNKHDMALKEMNFGKMCGRFHNRFKIHVEDFFMAQLRLQGFDQKFLNRSNYKIKLHKNNHFEKFKQFEVDNARSDLLNGLYDKMISGENFNQNPLFSREFILKNWLGFSDEDIRINKEKLKKEIKEFEEIVGGDQGTGGM